MAFAAAPLPYAHGALAPHMSEEQVTFHYEKHHKGYATRLNGIVADKPEYAGKTLIDLICSEGPGPVFNCAAQIFNHDFFWRSLKPAGGGGAPPAGALSDAIARDFGSFDAFKKEFSDAAAGHFGSGWAWLVADPAAGGKLKVHQTHDAACPVRDKLRPILACDVWEHAYYVDYRNDRAKYIAAWWSLVNWEFAEANLASAAM